MGKKHRNLHVGEWLRETSRTLIVSLDSLTTPWSSRTKLSCGVFVVSNRLRDSQTIQFIL